MSRGAKLTRIFLWISVLGWGICLGGKLFDLLILAGAYSAAPPDSLVYLPYGPHFPMNPGHFFAPLMLSLTVPIFGAAISGRKTPFGYRIWLLLSAMMFLLVWIITPTVFWPIIRELAGAASGETPKTTAEVVALLHRWAVWDWFRIALIAMGFIASVKAISVPYPEAK